MDLGPYASYRLPSNLRQAFGVETAQQLADQIGVTGEWTPDTAREGEVAYNAYRRGDTAAARSFLTGTLGLTDAVADDTLAKLDSASPAGA
jgi:hypothetical protein